MQQFEYSVSLNCAGLYSTAGEDSLLWFFLANRLSVTFFDQQLCCCFLNATTDSGLQVNNTVLALADGMDPQVIYGKYVGVFVIVLLYWSQDGCQ